MSSPVSPAIRHITTTAVVVVAAIAAVVSYSHMQQLAASAGESWRSWLIPLSIDGLVVAASMVLLTHRRANLPGGPLAWGALAAGVVASLAANMADAQPTPVAVLVAGWPAVAFAVAFELLLQQRRADRAGLTVPAQPAAASVPVAEPLPQLHRPLAAPPVTTAPWAPAPTQTGITSPASTMTVGSSAPGSPASSATSSSSKVDSSRSTAASAARNNDRTLTPPGDDDLVARVRRLLAESDGRVPGRRAVAKQLGVSEHQARGALDVVAATTGPALNGAGGRSKSTASGGGAR